MNDIKIPELLSPAGSMESLRAAIQNGCDAVYFGGKSFNARFGADNITDDEIKNAIEYCHLRNVKAYITLNTLYREDELEDVIAFAHKAYENGADAFIVQDIGMASYIKKFLTQINIHASTQMTAHSESDVRFLQSFGFKRVVLAREMNIQQIQSIAENVPNCELETFIHGALCVCYSGQCYMSSFLGERSGNRGKCAQTCRLNFSLLGKEEIKQGALLSPKDMMTLPILKDIVCSGVSTLKIEGRMRSPEYVALTTSIYRQALDQIKKNEENEYSDVQIKQLTQIFNRGGELYDGYYNSYSGKQMMSTDVSKSCGIRIGEVLNYDARKKICTIQTDEELIPGDGIEIFTKEPHVGIGINKAVRAGHIFSIEIEGNIEKGNAVHKSFDKKLTDEAKHSFVKDLRKIKMNAKLYAYKGQKLRIELYLEGKEECNTIKEGEIVQEAQKAPVSNEKLIEQISKSGDTTFKIEVSQSHVDDNVYIGIKDINELRREALLEFEQKFKISFMRKAKPISLSFKKDLSPITEKSITVSVRTKAQFDAAVAALPSAIYLEGLQENIQDISYFMEKSLENKVELFISLPRIVLDNSKLIKTINILENTDIKGYLIRTWGQAYILKASKKQKLIDYSLNCFNSLSVETLKEYGDRITLSVELNLSQMNKIKEESLEVIIYGKQPLMLTRQCPVGLYAGQKETSMFCKLKNSKEEFFLKDRKDKLFEIICECDNCMAYILNPTPVFVLNKITDFINSSLQYLRISITNESPSQVYAIVSAHVSTVKTGKPNQVSELVISDLLKSGVTNGHFYRGVL